MQTDANAIAPHFINRARNCICSACLKSRCKCGGRASARCARHGSRSHCSSRSSPCCGTPTKKQERKVRDACTTSNATSSFQSFSLLFLHSYCAHPQVFPFAAETRVKRVRHVLLLRALRPTLAVVGRTSVLFFFFRRRRRWFLCLLLLLVGGGARPSSSRAPALPPLRIRGTPRASHRRR